MTYSRMYEEKLEKKLFSLIAKKDKYKERINRLSSKPLTLEEYELKLRQINKIILNIDCKAEKTLIKLLNNNKQKYCDVGQDIHIVNFCMVN